MITKEEFITASEAGDLLSPPADVLFEKYPKTMESISNMIKEAALDGQDHVSINLGELGFESNVYGRVLSEFLGNKGYDIKTLFISEKIVRLNIAW